MNGPLGHILRLSSAAEDDTETPARGRYATGGRRGPRPARDTPWREQRRVQELVAAMYALVSIQPDGDSARDAVPEVDRDGVGGVVDL